MWMLPYLAVVAQQQLKLLQRSFNTGAFHRYGYYHCVCPCSIIDHFQAPLSVFVFVTRYVGETLLCRTCVCLCVCVFGGYKGTENKIKIRVR